MTTTLYCPAPYTKITSHGYDITQAGTAVPDDLVAPIMSAAFYADGVTLTSSAGGIAYTSVGRSYSPGVGAPTGDSFPSGWEVVDSVGTVYEKKGDGTWSTAATGTGTFAAVGSVVSDIAAVTTTPGALVVGKHNPVNASGGAKPMTLADAGSAGLITSVEKTDSSVSTVTITLNLRGTSSSVLTLFWQNESIVLVSKADGSWWPVAGHKTKTSIDAEIASVNASTFTPLPAFGALQYVDAVNGSNSNDGKSWGSAKATIAAASAALVTAGGGDMFLRPGSHSVGTAGSSTTAYNQPQNVRVHGSGYGYASAGGCEIVCHGTGIGWQTAASSSSIWAFGVLENVMFTNGDSITTLLDMHNAQNNSRVQSVIVGVNGPASTTGLAVTTNQGGNYPGFIKVRDCWVVGGSIPVDVTMGATNIEFEDCGIDTLDDATIGLRVNAGGNDAKSTFRWKGKTELHNGPSAPTASLNTDSTASQVTAGAHYYGMTWVTAAGESGLSVVSATITHDATHTSTTVTLPTIGGFVGPRIISRKLYRTTAGGSSPLLLTTISNNTTTSYNDVTPDGSLGAAYSQPAAGALGNPYAFQINALCRFDIEGEAYADAPCTSVAIDYEASPTSPSWPRGKFSLGALNFAAAWKAPHTPMVSVTIPVAAQPANSVFDTSVDFLTSVFFRDLISGGKAVTTAIALWGTGSTISLATNSNERTGTVFVTAGTGPAANPTVTMTYATNVLSNANSRMVLSPGTDTAGNAYPADGAFYVSHNSTGGTTGSRATVVFSGTPVAGRVYSFDYFVFT